MIGSEVFDVPSHQVHAHLGVGDRENIKRRSEFGVHIIHAWVAFLQTHQIGVPLEVTGLRIVHRLEGIFFTGAVFHTRVVHHEREVGVVERGFLDIAGVSQMTERP